MRYTYLLVLSLLFMVAGSGCTMVAPKYSPSVPNTELLKKAGHFSAKVGEFNSKNDAGDAISIRGHSMSSPYSDSYGAYLGEAIKEELILAGKLSADSSIEITGTLLENDMDAAIVTGHGKIEARFVVSKDGHVRYDKIKEANIDWNSSFFGAVAIPKAQQEYPLLVQELLKTLYKDSTFIESLR